MWSALHTLLLPQLVPLAPSLTQLQSHAPSAPQDSQSVLLWGSCCPRGQEHSPHLCSALLPGTAHLYFVPLLHLSPLEILWVGHLFLFIHLPLAQFHEGMQFVARQLSPLHWPHAWRAVGLHERVTTHPASDSFKTTGAAEEMFCFLDSEAHHPRPLNKAKTLFQALTSYSLDPKAACKATGGKPSWEINHHNALSYDSKPPFPRPFKSLDSGSKWASDPLPASVWSQASHFASQPQFPHLWNGDTENKGFFPTQGE